MEAIGKQKEKKVDCIPNNMEKYITFSMGTLQFIDTLQFLNSSLEKLVSNLAVEGIDKFKQTKYYLKTKFPHLPEDTIHLLLRKGVYPYDHVDGPYRFEETTLPPREAFYNSLQEEDITEDEYQHAQHVWKAFGIQNMGDYHDLYMETDVHLLADVFENFRDLCLEYYELDPCHFFTSPGLSWQACLKMTGVQLELLTDIDMHLFIERGLRGGISMISHRHGKANNPYLLQQAKEKYMELKAVAEQQGLQVPPFNTKIYYDEKQRTSYIMYLDANNL